MAGAEERLGDLFDPTIEVVSDTLSADRRRVPIEPYYRIRAHTRSGQAREIRLSEDTLIRLIGLGADALGTMRRVRRHRETGQ